MWLCLFDIHRVQYRNGLNTSMTYLTMVHSSWVVKSGRLSPYFEFWSLPHVNSHNWKARSSNSWVESQWVLTSILGSTAMWTLAYWQSMNSFRRPGVSVINTASILCYKKVSFSTFKISWNTYFLNYHCYTWFHGRHLIDSSSVLFSKPLTLANIYVFILSKLQIALMGFTRLGAAFDTETAHECTSTQLYDVRHARYAVPQCRPLDSRGLKCWLQLACHRVIWGGNICHNSKPTAVGKLKMIKKVLQMYGYPCSRMLALDLLPSISFRKVKRTGNQPQRTRIELHPMPNFDRYSKQWPMLWLVCLVMSIRPELNQL